jgi:hypothetical protein
LENNNFKLFNHLADNIENNLENIIKFVECDQFIEKIVAMFIFKLENNHSYPKNALERMYCNLFYERNYFDDEYDDDEDFSENDDEDLNAVVLKKKSRQTAGSRTYQNVILIKTLLKMINKKVQNNVKFADNKSFNVFSF